MMVTKNETGLNAAGTRKEALNASPSQKRLAISHYLKPRHIGKPLVNAACGKTGAEFPNSLQLFAD